MKEFIKNISIYGILPVIGRFIGFFLIPVYTRVFSSYEFGIVELIISLASFIMFACNLEFYSAIGRFFYDRKNLTERTKLVSTGLYLTLVSTIIVVFITYLAKDKVINFYLDGGDYNKEYNASLVWLFFSALYTYLGVIPRYDKKPKIYVLISVSSLLIRVSSTILYVLVLKTGIIGVIYGHITGSIASTVLNGIVSWKYIKITFNYKDAKEIFKFSLPIVPGLLIVGFWNPLSRNLVTTYYSVQAVGLLAFALRITSVIEIVKSAVHLAWNPMLFENYKKPEFKNEIIKISKFTAILSFYGAIFLTLLSPEITRFIGTVEYLDSVILIGFLALAACLDLIGSIRGFGPLIIKKTYLLTFVEVIGMILGIIILIVVKDRIGLIGVGFAFLLPKLIKYVLLVLYTANTFKIQFFNIHETIFVTLLSVSIIMIFFSTPLILRVLLLGGVSIYLFRQLKLKSFINSLNKGK